MLLTIALVLMYCAVKYVYKRLPKDLDEIFKRLDKFENRSVVLLRVLHKRVVFVNSPQLVQKVLGSEVCLGKPQLIYKLLNATDGLMSSKCKFSQCVMRICA